MLCFDALILLCLLDLFLPCNTECTTLIQQVNAPALASCSQPGGTEWVTLSTRLAAVLYALIQTVPTEVTVTVTGKALAGMKEAILAAALQGLVPGNCNLINAKAKALEKNITCSVKFTEVCDTTDFSLVHGHYCLSSHSGRREGDSSVWRSQCGRYCCRRTSSTDCHQ